MLDDAQGAAFPDYEHYLGIPVYPFYDVSGEGEVDENSLILATDLALGNIEMDWENFSHVQCDGDWSKSVDMLDVDNITSYLSLYDTIEN